MGSESIIGVALSIRVILLAVVFYLYYRRLLQGSNFASHRCATLDCAYAIAEIAKGAGIELLFPGPRLY